MTQKAQRTVKRIKREAEAEEAQKRLELHKKNTCNIKNKIVRVDKRTWKEVRV